ncbi:YitT family protein [Epibacterium sp. SM1969]|uniref:YitT family protein n=1 Tax=Tritonibacter aquimaris TaxID=2663379 RepID=A0A844AR78_9RHOB|nr:YitT family protein [Tritonibacter aquimaris]MQY43483.1 YitT family protein [Tritonibacter aquimaris]
MRSPISLYDIQGILFGVLMCALALLFLKSAGLVTGQLAGLALLLSYVVELNFGALFFLVSLPFFALAWVKRGADFTLRTIAAVSGISIVAPQLAQFIQFDGLDPFVAAGVGGALGSIGVIALFRHGASAGGGTILALLVEQKTGFKAGWFQLCVDAAIFLGAAFVLSWELLSVSFLGAAVTNVLIAWNFDVSQARRGAPA